MTYTVTYCYNYIDPDSAKEKFSVNKILVQPEGNMTK